MELFNKENELQRAGNYFPGLEILKALSSHSSEDQTSLDILEYHVR
jgi:hypothetical protein